jgi:hypothetical protein
MRDRLWDVTCGPFAVPSGAHKKARCTFDPSTVPTGPDPVPELSLSLYIYIYISQLRWFLETKYYVYVPRSSTLKMEAKCASETSGIL